jgi:hypothetical protein
MPFLRSGVAFGGVVLPNHGSRIAFHEIKLKYRGSERLFRGAGEWFAIIFFEKLPRFGIMVLKGALI